MVGKKCFIPFGLGLTNIKPSAKVTEEPFHHKKKQVYPHVFPSTSILEEWHDILGKQNPKIEKKNLDIDHTYILYCWS